MSRKEYLEEMDTIDVHNAIEVSGMPQEYIDNIWTEGEIEPGDKDKLQEHLDRLRGKSGV